MSEFIYSSSQPVTHVKQKPLTSFRTCQINSVTPKQHKKRSLSNFQIEYNQMAHKTKIHFNQKKLSLQINKKYSFKSTSSDFPNHRPSFSSFRIRTESSVTKNQAFPLKSLPKTKDYFKNSDKISIVVLSENNAKLKRKQYSCPIQIKQSPSKIMKGEMKSFFKTQSYLLSENMGYNNFHITKKRPKKYVKVLHQSHYSDFNETKGHSVGSFYNLKKIKQNECVELSEEGKNKFDLVFGHIERMVKIHDQLCPSLIRPKNIVKSIKNYILQKIEGSQQNPLEKLLNNEKDCNEFKLFLFLERCLLIGILNLVLLGKVQKMGNESRIMIESMIGVYLNLLVQAKDGQAQKLIKMIECKDIQLKKSVSQTNRYILSRIHSIFRYQSGLYYTLIKPMIQDCQQISINRAFYNLLTSFAAYLCQIQLQRDQCLPSEFTSLMTCPSPFILAPRKPNLKYTLVLDLDETLICTSFASDQFRLSNDNKSLEKSQSSCKKPKKGKSLGISKVRFRPHCLSFLKNVCRFYEIIIFTSSISQYAQEVTSSFRNYIDHILCRQHTIKKKGQTIKDLSRIGRSLQSSIIVDNLPQNFRLQKENGISIKSWYGDQNDDELVHLQNFLITLSQKDLKDIRKTVQQTHNFAQNIKQQGENEEQSFLRKLVRLFTGNKQ